MVTTLDKSYFLASTKDILQYDLMEYFKDNDRYFIRLDRGEDLFISLETFATREKLTSGHLSGIGALQDCELGFYHLHSKTYDRKMFSEEAELLSLDGNLSFLEEKPRLF